MAIVISSTTYMMIALGFILIYFFSWLLRCLSKSTRNTDSGASGRPTTLVFVSQRAPPNLLQPRRRSQPRPPPSTGNNNVDNPPPTTSAEAKAAPTHEVVINIACEDEKTVGGHGGDQDEVKDPDDYCSICLGEFEDDHQESDGVLVLAGCKHRFHEYCIKRWVIGHSTCPLCRKEMQVRRELRRLPVPQEICLQVVA